MLTLSYPVEFTILLSSYFSLHPCTSLIFILAHGPHSNKSAETVQFFGNHVLLLFPCFLLALSSWIETILVVDSTSYLESAVFNPSLNSEHSLCGKRWCTDAVAVLSGLFHVHQQCTSSYQKLPPAAVSATKLQCYCICNKTCVKKLNFLWILQKQLVRSGKLDWTFQNSALLTKFSNLGGIWQMTIAHGMLLNRWALVCRVALNFDWTPDSVPTMPCASGLHYCLWLLTRSVLTAASLQWATSLGFILNELN